MAGAIFKRKTPEMLVTDEMVEAACKAYWPKHWPKQFDIQDLVSIRRHMRIALEAALKESK